MLAASDDVARLAGEARALAAAWAWRGWPVIVRRDGAGAVGLPLPPSLGKLRLGLFVRPEQVSNRLDPVAAGEVAAAAPAAFAPQLAAAAALGHRLGLRPRVFGALLWQHLTGLAYLRPGSDIDLIWPVGGGEGLGELLDGLGAIDAAGPARLDGEIVLATGEAVNWRELRGERAKPDGAVLVKTLEGAFLKCPRQLFA